MKLLNMFVPVDPSATINDTKFENEFATLPHSSYEWERMYSSFVQTGDVAGARQYIEQLAESGEFITVGNVSKSELAEAKYLAVSLIAIVTRVAINNGADELKGYQTSDAFIQFIDTCNDTEKIVTQMFTSAEVMIQAVHDAKEVSENNLYFKRCQEYIGNHLNQKITVNDLAELCDLTPNYMSFIFKKISGKTITEYILDQRIQVAKRLLLTNEHTTAEIATFLGFSSQSYFIACFKKQVGETPRHWKMYHEKGSRVKLYPSL